MSGPISIDTTKTFPICNLKCRYSFNYDSSTAVLSNQAEYGLSKSSFPGLSLGNYTTGANTVKYNNRNINAKIHSMVFVPSLNQYNGKYADGELIVMHSGLAGQKLAVCLPIKSSSNATNDLATLLQPNNLQNITNANDSYVLNGRYNLNNLIPLGKPYYVYTARNFIAGTNEMCDFLVFPPINSINLSGKVIDMISKITKSNNYPICSIGCPEYYYNHNGASGIDGDNDIYIDCQPADEVPGSPLPPTLDPSDGKKEDETAAKALKILEEYLIVFAGFILVIIITVVLFKGFNSLLNILPSRNIIAS